MAKKFSEKERLEFKKQKENEMLSSIENLFNSDNWKKYLLLQGNNGYSNLNTLYIISQIGDRKFAVKGASSWSKTFEEYFKKQGIVVKEVGIEKAKETFKQLKEKYDNIVHKIDEIVKSNDIKKQSLLEQLKQEKTSLFKEIQNVQPIQILRPEFAKLTAKQVDDRIDSINDEIKRLNDSLNKLNNVKPEEKQAVMDKYKISEEKYEASRLKKIASIEKAIESYEKKLDTFKGYKDYLAKTGYKRIETTDISYYKFVDIWSISNVELIDDRGKQVDLPTTTIGINEVKVIKQENATKPELVIKGLKSYAKGLDVKVSFASIKDDKILDNAYGYFRPSTNEIVLRDNLSDDKKISVLAHELGHATLHGKSMKQEGITTTCEYKSSNIKEVEAESVAWSVCQHFGYDNKSSFEYIGIFAQRDETTNKENKDEDVVKSLMGKINKSLSAIRLATDSITSAIEKEVDKVENPLDTDFDSVE